jgi:hypothetical protein
MMNRVCMIDPFFCRELHFRDILLDRHLRLRNDADLAKADVAVNDHNSAAMHSSQFSSFKSRKLSNKHVTSYQSLSNASIAEV